ncbi:MAG: FAD:protein FMN transferase, partial [Bryobacteraceae bacterium]
PPGAEGWRVAACNQIFVLRNTAMSTSGDSEQFVEIDGVRYSHIVDPGTGLGLTARRTVTVQGPLGITADAWATAVSVGAELNRREYNNRCLTP